MLNNFKILSKPLPLQAASYAKEVKKGDEITIDGSKHTIDESFFSDRNSYRTQIRLNPALVRALEKVVNAEGAIGIQEINGEVNYLVTEIENKDLNLVIATAYNPASGELRQCSKAPKGKKVQIPPAIDGTHSDGVEVWYTILSALIHANEMGEKYLNYVENDAKEIKKILLLIMKNNEDGNMYKEPALIYRLQDTISAGICDAAIPLALPSNQASLKEISNSNIKSALYEPTRIIKGSFTVLVQSETQKKLKTVKDYGNKFYLGITLTEEQQSRVPKMDSYVVSETALSLVQSIHNTPHRCYMIGGPSGTGKSTDIMIIAALLNIPYGAFSCSEGTDETDITTKFVPNTNQKPPEYLTRQLAEEIYEDLMFDPQTAVATLTGEEYNEKLTGPQCITKIINYFVENQRKADKDFQMVPSEIVRGAQEPSITEIQELDLVGRPGTFPVLNRFLNEGVIEMADGTKIERDPNSFYFFTANLTYEGCRELNQALKSRCQRIIMVNDLSEDDMVSRLQSSENFEKYATKNGYSLKDARDLAKNLASCITKMKAYVSDQQISGSVCGYREYEAWFYETLAMHSARKAAESTIITHITLEDDIKFDVQNQLFTMLPEETED